MRMWGRAKMSLSEKKKFHCLSIGDEMHHYCKENNEDCIGFYYYDEETVLLALKELDDIIENRKSRLKGFRDLNKKKSLLELYDKPGFINRKKQLIEDLRFFKKIRELFGGGS